MRLTPGLLFGSGIITAPDYQCHDRGIEEALALNRDISGLGARFNIGIAVGSQTIALENKQLAKSFKIVRKVNRDGLILANVAANSDPRMAVRAIRDDRGQRPAVAP